MDNELKWEDWSNSDLILVRGKVIVIINWNAKCIYCVDLIKGKMVKGRQGIISAWSIAMTAYDERNGKIYVSYKDTRLHDIFDVKRYVPLSLFTEEVVDGWVRMNIVEVYRVIVPQSLCKLIVKFLPL